MRHTDRAAVPASNVYSDPSTDPSTDQEASLPHWHGQFSVLLKVYISDVKDFLTWEETIFYK